MSLEAKVALDAIRTRYAADAAQKTLNLLLIGESGVGKTVLVASTARPPVLIDSFDPGGTKGLSEEISSGRVIVDTQFEGENPLRPSVFKEWQKEFQRRFTVGVFNEIGTYCIDSATFLAAAIMNARLAGSKSEVLSPAPKTDDYQIVAHTMATLVHDCTHLPCDFILTGHIQKRTNEETGKFHYVIKGYPSITGQLPAYFDECYVMTCEDAGATKTKRQLVTGRSGLYECRTRIGRGKFDLREPPDLTALIKKAGLPNIVPKKEALQT